jgi:hypothetical protein
VTKPAQYAPLVAHAIEDSNIVEVLATSHLEHQALFAHTRSVMNQAHQGVSTTTKYLVNPI